MHQNSFGGEPFDAAGETVGAVHARQRAQPVAQQRPFAAFFREPVVVVRFTVVRQHTDALALFVRMVEIAGDLRAGSFLEQLRVGPLHPALGQQCFRFVPAAAKPFEQEERFGKFLAHAGGDVLPDRHRHFVTRVAAEAVHTASAPGEKRFSQVVPKFPFARVQLDQILPGHAPRAGTEERAVLAAQKPLWMPLVEGGTPAGMIDDKVQKEPPPERMDRVGQFTELFDAGRAPIELNQRRVDGC